MVYPHYFSGAKLRFAFTEAVATKQTFDPRWTLFFTPHSAALEPNPIARAQGSWWWNEAPSRFDIPGIRAGAQRARDSHCTRFIPSLDRYSYVETYGESGEPWLRGQRQVPLGFGWLAEGATPYRELPMRAARLAYREFASNPDLGKGAFHAVMCRELFEPSWRIEEVQDALELCRVFGTDRGWSVRAPLATPGMVQARPKSGRLDSVRRAMLRDQLARVRAIAASHQDAKNDGARALTRIARRPARNGKAATDSCWRLRCELLTARSCFCNFQ